MTRHLLNANIRATGNVSVFGLLLCATFLAGCEGPAQTPVIAPTQPLAVQTPPPNYPAELACDDKGGTVGLIMAIDTDGTPVNIRVERSSGHAALDQSAIEAVQGWQFRPASRNGEPVQTDLRVPVTFTPPTMRPDMCFQLDEQRSDDTL